MRHMDNVSVFRPNIFWQYYCIYYRRKILRPYILFQIILADYMYISSRNRTHYLNNHNLLICYFYVLKVLTFYLLSPAYLQAGGQGLALPTCMHACPYDILFNYFLYLFQLISINFVLHSRPYFTPQSGVYFAEQSEAYFFFNFFFSLLLSTHELSTKSFFSLFPFIY